VDADRWNERYSGTELVWTAGPNVFVAREVAGLSPGRALDLACGEGRNAVWLAEQGWDATGVDFAEAGLAKGRAMADERGVEVTWACADVTSWEPAGASFDLVVVAYLQLAEGPRRRAMAVAAGALAPGGTLLVVAHDSANLTGGTGGPPDPAVLYRPDDVLADLEGAGFDVVVERAETVERAVAGVDRPALDCLVRVTVTGRHDGG
jgi:SAM-dependent methyltransferase